MNTQHRRQVFWQIGLPLAVTLVVLVGVGIGLAVDGQRAAQGGALAVILLSCLAMLAGLPWLVALILLVVGLWRGMGAVQRGLRRLAQVSEKVERRTVRWAQRSVQPLLTLESHRAAWAQGVRSLWGKLRKREEV